MTRFHAPLLLGLLGLLVLGCEEDVGDYGKPCASEADCSNEFVCRLEQCLRPGLNWEDCDGNNDCSEGLWCAPIYRTILSDETYEGSVCSDSTAGMPCHPFWGVCLEGLSCSRHETLSGPGHFRCIEAGSIPQDEYCDYDHECGNGMVCHLPPSCEYPREDKLVYGRCKTPGSQQAGCCRDEECQSDLSCLTFLESPVCGPLNTQATGEPCGSYRHCKSGLVCNLKTSTCLPPGGNGDPCDGESDCREDFFCLGSTSLVCTDGSRGAPCDESPDCDDDLYCVDHRCSDL